MLNCFANEEYPVVFYAETVVFNKKNIASASF